jgi:hypothetical protein
VTVIPAGAEKVCDPVSNRNVMVFPVVIDPDATEMDPSDEYPVPVFHETPTVGRVAPAAAVMVTQKYQWPAVRAVWHDVPVAQAQGLVAVPVACTTLKPLFAAETVNPPETL